jgi:hypothetical protein
MAANLTWAIRLQIEDWDSGLPLTTIRLRDKSVLIKPIWGHTGGPPRGDQQESVSGLSQVVLRTLRRKFCNDCEHRSITSAEAIAPSESATCFAQLNRRE